MSILTVSPRGGNADFASFVRGVMNPAQVFGSTYENGLATLASLGPHWTAVVVTEDPGGVESSMFIQALTSRFPSQGKKIILNSDDGRDEKVGGVIVLSHFNFADKLKVHLRRLD